MFSSMSPDSQTESILDWLADFTVGEYICNRQWMAIICLEKRQIYFKLYTYR